MSTELVRRRDQARADRDWDLADELRGQLEDAGWVVEDGPEGTRIRLDERRVNEAGMIGPSGG